MRFLIRVVGLLFAMYAALSRRVLAAFSPAGHVAATTTVAGHLVKDPVCGTYVPERKAIQASGQFFCSEECRRKFQQLTIEQ